MSWQAELDEMERRAELARQMGGPDSVAFHHGRGKLTVRERIDLLTDPGGFEETGVLAGKPEWDGSRLAALTPGQQRRRRGQDQWPQGGRARRRLHHSRRLGRRFRRREGQLGDSSRLYEPDPVREAARRDGRQRPLTSKRAGADLCERTLDRGRRRNVDDLIWQPCRSSAVVLGSVAGAPAVIACRLSLQCDGPQGHQPAIRRRSARRQGQRAGSTSPRRSWAGNRSMSSRRASCKTSPSPKPTRCSRPAASSAIYRRTSGKMPPRSAARGRPGAPGRGAALADSAQQRGAIYNPRRVLEHGARPRLVLRNPARVGQARGSPAWRGSTAIRSA